MLFHSVRVFRPWRPADLVWPLWLAVAVCLGPLFSRPLHAQTHRMPAASPGLLEAGSPPFVVIGAEGLGLNSPPTDMHLMPDGRILVYAYPQIALGDGIRWETFRHAPTDTPSQVTSVAVGDDGKIYLAVTGGFASVEFEADGFWRLRFTAPWPKSEHPERPVPRSAIVVGDDWFWHSGSGSVISWRPGRDARGVGNAGAFEHAFAIGEISYVCDRTDARLSRLRADGTVAPVLPPGRLSAGEVITCSTPYDAGRALIGTYSRGVQLFDGSSTVPFPAAGVLEGGHRINALCATEGDMFAAAVESYGIVFFDRGGRTVQVLDHSHDHRLARVQRLQAGPGGVIWGLVAGGIVRVEFPSRVSSLEALLGTGATSVQLARLDGRLWVLGDGKVFRSHYDANGRITRFETDSPPDRDVFAISAATGVIIASTGRGPFYRADSGWVEFGRDVGSFRIIDPKPIDGRWLYAAQNEVGWLRRTATGIDLERIPTPGLDAAYNCATDARGDIWMELGTARFARVRLENGRPVVTNFGLHDGVPDGWAQVFVIDGIASFNVADQLFRFDEGTQRFVPDTDFPRRFPGIVDVVGRPGRDAAGRLWIAANGTILVLDDRDGPIRNVGEKMPPGLRPFYFTFEEDGVVWLHADRRLTRYDPKMPLPRPVSFKALITHVTATATNRSFFAVDRELPEFDYADNSLIAHFLAPGNPFAAPVTFEVKLEGADAEWAPVGGAGSAVFNRLKEGRYVLRVRPKSGGVAGAEATLAFSIRPPWYRSTFAYIGYAGSSLAIVFLVGRLLSFLQRRENNRLERLVALRTSELNASHDQLASQVDEIQMLSQAVEQSPVAVYITRPAGAIVFANRRACELSGRTLAELVGADPRFLRAEPETPRETLDQLEAAVKRGEAWRGQLVNRHKDGHIVHVRSMLAPIRSPDGTIRHHLILDEDITEWLADQERRRGLEAQLFQAQKLESVGTLAGGIAHDFNNILTGILGYSELARLATEDDAEVQRHLAEVRTAGLRAKDLVAQILTFSRQSHMELVPLNLADPVSEAVKLVRATTPTTIELVSTIESGMVRADATQIQQVVLNLCTNAAHAIGPRPGRIEVSLQRVAVTESLSAEVPNLAVGARLRLSVSDNGAGMDRSTLDRIFDPFFTTKRQGEGTGLGLAIVQGIVAGHQAALRVRSTPRSGTTFEIYFPLTEDPRPVPPATTPVPRGNLQEIIVVDDERSVANFAASRLQQLGYLATVFCEPRAALDAFEAEPSRFQAIVTDLTMPNLTGEDLIQTIRSRGWLVPAVIVTGYGSDAIRARLAAVPRCAVLTKPFSGDDLARILAQVMRDYTVRSAPDGASAAGSAPIGTTGSSGS